MWKVLDEVLVSVDLVDLRKESVYTHNKVVIAIHIIFKYVHLKSPCMHGLHSSYWFMVFLLMAPALWISL